jgi:alpha-beta hydrolase superfamily lysophospholipase
LTRRSHVRFAEPVPKSSQHIVELRLATTDGEDIGAWYVAGDSQKPTVLLIHGNGGQRKACWPQAEMLSNAGYPVMLISCRAHGDSSGQTNDFGWSAKQDVIAAVKWVAAKNPRPRIVVWGASLGSAAAIFAAAELDQSVSGYILECPYQDLETAVWHRLEHYLPPVLDGVAYLGMRLAAGVILPQIEQISPLNHIETIPHQVPILILAGGMDERARPDEARALHSRVSSHCQLEIIEQGDHLQLQRAAPQEYQNLALKFLDQISTGVGPT